MVQSQINKIEQVAITTTQNSTYNYKNDGTLISESVDADLSRCFKERYHKSSVEDEHLASLQMAKSSYMKLKQSRISSQPNIISQPIIQNGAVRAVTLFECKNKFYKNILYYHYLNFIQEKIFQTVMLLVCQQNNQNLNDFNNSHIKSQVTNNSFYGNANPLMKEQPTFSVNQSANYNSSGTGIIGIQIFNFLIILIF